MKSALFSVLLLALTSLGGAADEMKSPRLIRAQVDWSAAAPAPSETDALTALVQLNTVMSQRLPGTADSPVPVLLPFDTAALLHDQADETADPTSARYLSGFKAGFFYPGPSGYDAAFTILAADIPEVSEARFRDPIEVQITGSLLLYDLDVPITSAGTSVPSLEADFPGIRRQILEHHLRYTFVRFGVPYAVSIACFDASVPRYKMPTCRTADQVALRFLRALHVAGGTPQHHAEEPVQIWRPRKVSETFTYGAPGRLLSGTGFRGQGGRADYTAYSQIRFPIAEAPAYAHSQMYRVRSTEPGVAPNYSYPWRDNFCERRGFPVAQCPAGVGHQGQDIKPARCKPPAGSERCVDDADLVAVRDGMILRAPRQEAVYLFVNTASEHIRFRYLHMNPRKMDDDNVLSGRRVHEGEVIGKIGNFSMHENGTSYHLHFDVQVPTKDGWVFVNPYMTLVSAYERLIGERGTELTEPTLVSSADPEVTSTVGQASRIERHHGKHWKAHRHANRHARNHGRHKGKRHRTRVASH